MALCVLEMIERSLRQPKDSFLLLPRKQALVGAKVKHSKYYKHLKKASESTDILLHVQFFLAQPYSPPCIDLPRICTSLSWPMYSPSQYAVPNVSGFKAQPLR